MVISFLKGFATMKNAAILIALCATAFAVQSLRIKWLKSDKSKLEAEIVSLTHSIDIAVSANESNQVAIKKLMQANKECALNNQIFQANVIEQEKKHKDNIAHITNKYNDLRKIKVTSVCGNSVVDDNSIILLRTASSQRD